MLFCFLMPKRSHKRGKKQNADNAIAAESFTVGVSVCVTVDLADTNHQLEAPGTARQPSPASYKSLVEAGSGEEEERRWASAGTSGIAGFSA